VEDQDIHLGEILFKLEAALCLRNEYLCKAFCEGLALSVGYFNVIILITVSVICHLQNPFPLGKLLSELAKVMEHAE
jgi:hypothetical protein